MRGREEGGISEGKEEGERSEETMAELHIDDDI